MKIISLLLFSILIPLSFLFSDDLTNNIIGKVSSVKDMSDIRAILFYNIPESVKLVHIYDKEKEKVVGSLMIKQRRDDYLCTCNLVDGDIVDIKPSQDLYINYDVFGERKEPKFLDFGISYRSSEFLPNNYLITPSNNNFLTGRGSIVAEFLESIIIGGYISGNFSDTINFGIFGKYILGNSDDIISLYGVLDLGVGLYNSGRSLSNTTPTTYFSIQPGIGVIMLRKYNYQIFMEVDYKLPITQNSFNNIAGFDIGIGMNIYFTKNSLFIYALNPQNY